MTPTARAALAALIAFAPVAGWAQEDDAGTREAAGASTGGDAIPADDATTGAEGDAEPAEAGTVTRYTVPVETAPSEAEADLSPEARGRADAEGLRRLDAEGGDDPLAEAVEALDLTGQALGALAVGDEDRALDLLARATGEIEMLIARRPVLALAPADTQIIERDLVGSVGAAETLREEIEDLVDDGRLQQARGLMRDFASEIALVTTSLPLATYPDALLRAAAEVEAGQPEVATAILTEALSTAVIEEVAIPLPPLRAEAVLLEAEALVASPERTEEEDARLDGLLEVAREQVRMGQVLGYGTRDDYEAVLDAIDRVEDEAVDTPAERAFARVRERLSGIFD